jgi:hypothetical protein
MTSCESSELPSMRELLVEKLAGIGLDKWEALCFRIQFEKMSPKQKAMIERASALYQPPKDSPNFQGPNICDLSKEDQAAVFFYWKTKDNSSLEASGMHASCVSPPLVPEMLQKLLMFLGFPSHLLNLADLPGTIAAVMIHFREQVSSFETHEKMKEVCNPKFICDLLKDLKIPESCVIDQINRSPVQSYPTITAFFEEVDRLKMDRIRALIAFGSAAEGVIFEVLQRTTPMTPQLMLGQKLSRFSQRTMKLNPIRWSRRIITLSCRDSGLFTNYDTFLKNLNEQAQKCVYEIHDNIPKMFFRICEELGIPAELLDRENLVESLSNVFLHIVRLSDEIRSADHESPDFLEILQRYKRIVDAFFKLKFDKFFFRDEEELRLFFESMDEKLQQSGKDVLASHTFSSITDLFMTTDFVMDGFFNPVHQSEDLLQLTFSAIILKYHSCVGDSVDKNMGAFCRKWFVNKQEAEKLVEVLCKIFEDFEKHPLFSMQTMKLNVLCKLLPWEEFTEFLQSIRDRHPEAHEFICLTLRSMAEKIQGDITEGMDEHYARVLSRYPSGGFVADRAQISNFVCNQLLITDEFGQVDERRRRRRRRRRRMVNL